MTLDQDDLRTWTERHRDELVSLVMRLVAIPSVGEVPSASPTHPFGAQCARMLEETRYVAHDLGFVWKDHEGYAASLTANPEGSRRIAFFSHIDVVPAGDGWSHDPFSPYLRDGWIFGRGSIDNKGPAAAVLLALRYLVERYALGNTQVVVYLGCDEERGMADVRHLVATEPAADVSLVSDCAFPVCVAEKGVLGGVFKTAVNDAALLAFGGGTAHNAVAGSAEATIRNADGAQDRLRFEGRGAHAAFPEGSVNAIVLAAAALSRDERLAQTTRAAFAKVARLFSPIRGKALGIAAADDFMGPLTCVATRAWLREGMLSVEFNVRHPSVVDEEWLVKRLSAAAVDAGFALRVTEASPAHRVDANQPLVNALTDVVNQTLGTDVRPYCLPGATHARWIPGAVGFGATMPWRGHPEAPPHGGGHEPDEAVCVDDLLDAVRVYANAIAFLAEG